MITTPHLSFLYNARTILRCKSSSSSSSSWVYPVLIQKQTYASDAHPASSNSRVKKKSLNDNAIPFDWGDEGPPPQMHTFGRDMSSPSDVSSTMTPGEAGIFERIFEEISQGKASFSHITKENTGQKNYGEASRSPSKIEKLESSASRSVVNKTRMSGFREQVLTRYPESLRSAARLALGSFETKDSDDLYSEPSQKENERRKEWEMKRKEERDRVEAIMDACQTDIELWRVMEYEVFQLPARLGLVQGTTSIGVTTQSDNTVDQNIMTLHGPLFSHFLIHGLRLFESRFERTSPFTFHILPRIKVLGLPAYVLGVSTNFYAALADVHWTRFGDANGALDAVQEMINVGLPADQDIYELLSRIRDDINCGVQGTQGAFVQAIMKTSAYTGDVMQRIDAMLGYAGRMGDDESQFFDEGFDKESKHEQFEDVKNVLEA